MNSSAASSTWQLSSTSLNGKGESVTLSRLTNGLRPKPGSAGDAAALAAITTAASIKSASESGRPPEFLPPQSRRPAAAAWWWWWWKMRFWIASFPATLPRLIMVLTADNNFPFEKPFLSMKYIAWANFQIFLATIARFCSILGEKKL
ncbi:major facilitator superfamily protein [Striga asiatica]|uniref:Major facilitator superfamily protein n=1 Tax=Striga asiatica TaxID=4170 RepID=A0A5A7QI27_STRAF|nr:major facilitator superfamily protein [Striga asiatica]